MSSKEERAHKEINMLYPGLALYIDGLGLHLSKRYWNDEVETYIISYAEANGFRFVRATELWLPHRLELANTGG